MASNTMAMAASLFTGSHTRVVHGTQEQSQSWRRNQKSVSSISGCWKIQCSKSLKRIASAGSEVKLVGTQRSTSSMGCCRGSYLLRQLFWKLKSQWKQALGRKKCYNRFSYDLQSYSLNFDDGFDGHRS